jgi:pre-mRNA-splicing factor RBM22/SLT11
MAFMPFGEIKSVVMARKVKCAFVNFVTRSAAEQAAEHYSHTPLQINGHTLRMTWGRPRPQGPQSELQQRRPATTNDQPIQPPPPPPSHDQTIQYPSQGKYPYIYIFLSLYLN